MLLRFYRVTDKLGWVFAKLLAAAGDWLNQGISAGSGAVWRLLKQTIKLFVMLLAAITTLVVAILAGAGRLLMQMLRAIGRLFMAVLGTIVALLGGAGRVAAKGTQQVAQQGRSRAARASSDRMARRADVAAGTPDVTITQDPLLVQNRRLSLLLALAGVAIVGLILWATDPARSTPAPLTTNVGSGLVLNATAQPTPAEPAAIAAPPTPFPTATQLPVALRAGGTLAYTVRERGQTDIWLLTIGSADPVRLTNDPADERDPRWSPDGSQLAYASRENGNWELFIYDITSGNKEQMTVDLSFQGDPDWSPDGEWLLYESYQGSNLDVYAVRIDGTALERITDHPAPDFSPAWSPDGRRIAFVSLRDGNQDIYVFDLNTADVSNLTASPLRDEEYPAWSPDGRFIAFSAWEQGTEKVFVQPTTPGAEAVAVGFGRAPSWSPAGDSLVFAVDAVDGTVSYLSVRPYGREGGVATEVVAVPYGATSPSWSDRALPPQFTGVGPAISEPLYVEQTGNPPAGVDFGLKSLPGVQAENALLSDAVDDSFNALRERVAQEAGYDYLRQLDEVFWLLERPPQPGEEIRSWFKTGRAFSIRRNSILGFPPEIELVREDIGVDTFWRVYLRVDDDFQSGQLGEPLRALPWDFLSVQSGDIEAYNQGGRRRAEIPTGYYIDLTQLAEDYGWPRRAAGFDWRANANSRNYWLFWRPEDLNWYEAMLQIWPEGQLINFAPTATPAPAAESAGDS